MAEKHSPNTSPHNPLVSVVAIVGLLSLSPGPEDANYRPIARRTFRLHRSLFEPSSCTKSPPTPGDSQNTQGAKSWPFKSTPPSRASSRGDFKGESNPERPRRNDPLRGLQLHGVTVPHGSHRLRPGLRQTPATARYRHQGVGASSPQFYAAAYTNEVLTQVAFNFYVAGPTGLQQLWTTPSSSPTPPSSPSSNLIHLPQSGGPIIDSRELE